MWCIRRFPPWSGLLSDFLSLSSHEVLILNFLCYFGIWFRTKKDIYEANFGLWGGISWWSMPCYGILQFYIVQMIESKIYLYTQLTLSFNYLFLTFVMPIIQISQGQGNHLAIISFSYVDSPKLWSHKCLLVNSRGNPSCSKITPIDLFE